MIEKGFNYANSTITEMNVFFETRGEKLEPKEDKKKSSSAVMKSREKKSSKKREREDSNSSVVESSDNSSVQHRTTKKYCILYGKCSHFTDKCQNLRIMLN